ncbi:MAG: GTP 3',8-cyclase MoaA, partial [Perlucidibaca sp.]
FGREISYLRLSVTDRCDFRCVYCMAEDMQFLPRSAVLSLEEMERLARVFVSLGIRKIRLTGGEPLVRRGLPELVARLGALPGLQTLAMTTNGARLAAVAPMLRASGLKQLNISLDSLDPARFRELTRTGTLADVLAGVAAAVDAGFPRIRLNSVILRGRNEDEVPALVAYAERMGVDLAFIEEMPLGSISEHDRALAHVSGQELLDVISARWQLLPEATQELGGPARYHWLAGSHTRVGVITPHSQNFCASCNRIRLTAEGRLLLCLGHEHSLD